MRSSTLSPRTATRRWDDFSPRYIACCAPGGSFLFADLRSRKGLDALHEQFHASHLNLEYEDDISANVLMALRLDNDRKLQLIEDLIPWPFRRPFRTFAGIEGTTNYVGLENGRLHYVSAHLTKSS